VPGVAFVLIGVLLTPTARRSPRPSRDGVPLNPLPGYARLVRHRHVRVVLGATALEGALFMGIYGYLGAFLRHEYALSYTAIGLVLASFGCGGIAYAAVAKPLIRRLGQPGLVLGGGAVVAGGLLVVALAPSWIACVPALALVGVGFFMLHTTLQTRATEMAPETRGAAVAAFAASIFFGQTVGVGIIAALLDGVGYRPLIAVSAGGLLVLATWFRLRLPELERARLGGQASAHAER